MAAEPIHASIMGCTSSAPNMATNQNATEKVIEFSDDDESGLSVKEDNNVNSTSEQNGVKETKVLPCDTLADTIQLDSNNKSVIDTSDIDMDKAFNVCTDMKKMQYLNTATKEKNGVCDYSSKKASTTTTGNKSKIQTRKIKNNTSNRYLDILTDTLESEETKAKESKDIITEEKLSSLEDVVEKVVELYVSTDTLSNSTHDIPEQIPKIQEIIETASKVESDRITDKIDECENEHSEPTEESAEEALSPSQSTSSRATRWEALADIAAELPPSLTVDPLTGQIYALSK